MAADDRRPPRVPPDPDAIIPPPATREVRRRLVLEAPVDAVWRALTDPDELAAWWGEGTDPRRHPRRARAASARRTADAGSGVVVEVRPEPPPATRLVREDPDSDEPATRVTIELTPCPFGTVVTVRRGALRRPVRARRPRHADPTPAPRRSPRLVARRTTARWPGPDRPAPTAAGAGARRARRPHPPRGSSSWSPAAARSPRPSSPAPSRHLPPGGRQAPRVARGGRPGPPRAARPGDPLHRRARRPRPRRRLGRPRRPSWDRRLGRLRRHLAGD